MKVFYRLICALFRHVTPLTKLKDGVIVIPPSPARDPQYWNKCIRCGALVKE